MTPVLTALAPDHIVQVSDRRGLVTHMDGTQDLLDGHVKAVVTPRFVCSYTGVALLPAGVTNDTADWIAIQLSDHIDDGDGGVSALVDRAREDFASLGCSDLPLEIVTAGWVADDVDNAVPAIHCADRATHLRPSRHLCWADESRYREDGCLWSYPAWVAAFSSVPTKAPTRIERVYQVLQTCA